MQNNFDNNIDWNSVEAPKKKGSDFLKLQDGRNQVRIISNPKSFLTVWLDNGSQKKRFVIDETNKGLQQWLKDNKTPAKETWMVCVLLRKEMECKLLEIGVSIFSDIKALASDPDWGKPSQYDVVITKNLKAQSPKDIYKVLPSAKVELTSEQKVLAQEFNDRINFDALKKPNDVSDIFLHLGMTIPKNLAPASAKPSSQKALKPSKGDTYEDEEFEFKMD